MALRTVGVRLTAEISQYTAAMRRAGADTRGFVGELDRAARAGRLDAVADQAGRMGLALTAGFAAVVAASARYEKAMSSVNAATHASAEEMQRLSAAALKAGKDTQFSATDAAKGIEELAKAGVSTADILGGGLTGALDLAAAGEIEVGEAAETAASALVQFRLRGSQVSHVADLLAAGAGKAQGSVRDMAQALNQSGLVASQMGLSIEETTGALASFASAGLLGSDAGTSFKTMLLRLAAPTGEAKALIDGLGISAFDAQGKFVGMAKFAGSLRKALEGMSEQQRLATLNTIFGTDAIRAAAITYQQGERGVQRWIDSVNETGFASDTAARKTDNLIGDIERLTGELETLAIQSGSGPNKGLRFLAQLAEQLVSRFGALPPVVSSTVVTMAGLGGAVLLAFAAWVKMRGAIAKANAELAAVGPRAAAVAGKLQTVGKWAGRAAGAFAALQVASALIATLQDDLNPQLGALTKGLQDWAKSGRLAGEAARVLGGELTDLDAGLKFLADKDNSRRQAARHLQEFFESWVPGLDGTNTSLAKTKQRVDAVDQALAGLVQSGSGDDARRIFDRLAASQAKQGVSTKELMDMFPQYAAALEESAKVTGELAVAQDRAAVNSAILNGGFGALVEESGSLEDAIRRLHGATIDFAKAEIGAEEALDRLSESMAENGKTMNVNTEKGRANKSALLGVVDAATRAAQAKFDETKSVEEATKVYDGYIGRLRETLAKQGLQPAQIDKIIKKYAEIPPLVTTEVKTKGASEAENRLKVLRALLDHISQISNISIRADTGVGGGRSQVRRWGGITEHAQTGLLREADVYSSAYGTRYAFAEPATGGEAFVPRRGNAQRSLDILDRAASWYGHQLMPTGGMGAGSIHVTVSVTGQVLIRGTGIASGIREYVDLRGGGSVQRAFGRKGVS